MQVYRHIQLWEIQRTNKNKEVFFIDNKSVSTILFIGSCRIHIFLNYFLNDPFFSDKYNYACILVYEIPAGFNEHVIEDEAAVNIIRRSKILISEYLVNYEYFNTSRDRKKNIFKIHDLFDLHISLPNYMKPALYMFDIMMHDSESKQKFDNFILFKTTSSLEELKEHVCGIRDRALDRWYNAIDKSDLPELRAFVSKNYLKIRMGHNPHHPTNAACIEMYRLLCLKFFNKDVPSLVLDINSNVEFLADPSYDTKLTYYDRLLLDYRIQEGHLDEELSNEYIHSRNKFWKQV